eukprot:9475414-Pyramimonas_sp.AAC.1
MRKPGVPGVPDTSPARWRHVWPRARPALAQASRVVCTQPPATRPATARGAVLLAPPIRRPLGVASWGGGDK